jgi:hypothetical protein
MFGIGTDYSDHALAPDDLAFLATDFYARTNFHFIPVILLMPVNYPASIQIVRRQLQRHLISGQDLDKMHPHFARNMRQYLMPIIELYPKHRVRQRLDNLSLDFYYVFFSHTTLQLKSPGRWPLLPQCARNAPS